MYRRHNRYNNIIILDSLYATTPILYENIDQKMISVIRVKQQNYHIIRDVEALFAGRKPTSQMLYRLTVFGVPMRVQAVASIVTW